MSKSCLSIPELCTNMAAVPFLLSIVVSLLCSCYMLFGPSGWVTRVMQLTFLSRGFASWLLALAIGSFLFAWLAERTFYPFLAKILGDAYIYLRPAYRKQRRQYKVLLDNMQK